MINGKAIAKFGSGDILITPLVSSDFSGGHIVLQNKGTHVVGEYSSAEDARDAEDQAQTFKEV